jgi:hypothetical protein
MQVILSLTKTRNITKTEANPHVTIATTMTFHPVDEGLSKFGVTLGGGGIKPISSDCSIHEKSRANEGLRWYIMRATLKNRGT